MDLGATAVCGLGSGRQVRLLVNFRERESETAREENKRSGILQDSFMTIRG